MFEILIKEHFDAAHKLRGYIGKCANIHGHTWEVEVIVSGEKQDELGMLIDFKIIKEIVKAKINIFDHQYINEIEAFNHTQGLNPTAENIAFYIYKLIKDEITSKYKQINLKEVKVWESPRACATYKED